MVTWLERSKELPQPGWQRDTNTVTFHGRGSVSLDCDLELPLIREPLIVDWAQESAEERE